MPPRIRWASLSAAMSNSAEDDPDVPGGFFESQVATIDVIEDREGSLVLFSVDAMPDAMIAPLSQAYGAALASLKNLLES